MKKTTSFVFLALFLLAGQALAQTLPVRLVSPYPITDGRFGKAIATLGDRIIVGAPNDTLQGIRTGAAYLIEAATGRTLLTFRPRVLTRNANFGFAVAAANDRVLIGAPNDDARGVPNAGAAYLFNATTGALDAVIAKVTPVPGDSFGFAVAIAGDNLIIGTPRDDAGARDAGAVYMVDILNAGQGVPSRTVPNPAPGDFDVFGTAVAAIGANFAVGVPSDSPTYPDQTVVGDAGSVHLYNNIGERIGNFPNPTRSVAGSFGAALAAFGNDILVGAPTTVAAGIFPPPQVGAAHLIDGSSGALLLTIPNPAPNAGDRFGDAVAVVGNNILIGAPFDDLDADNAGIATRFDRAGSEVSLFRNPAPAANDIFGVVAALGNDVLVGAPGKAVNGLISAGAVYRFGIDSRVSFSNDSLRFGNVSVNANADLTVRVTNTGTANLAISSTRLAGANANQFSIVSGGSDGSLAPNAARDITLRFSPTSVGNKSAFFVLNSNATSTPDTVKLTGAGGAPQVSFSSDRLGFGNVLVNANSDLTLRLTNTGTANLDISRASLAGANANQFSIITGGGAGTLAPNTVRDIALRFSPTSGGNKIAFFVFNSNAASSPDTVTLTGTGVTVTPTCLLSVTSIRDGAQIIADSALVNGRVVVSNFGSPFTTRVTINGIAARVTNTANGARFGADMALPIIGANQLRIEARVTGTDTTNIFTCQDTIIVVRAVGTPETCVNFEALPFGTKFGVTSVGVPDAVGDIIFRENKIPVSIENFRFDPNTIAFGFCQIENSSASFGSGQIIRLDEVSLKLDFTQLGFQVNQVTFDCLLTSGDIQNIAVNDGTLFIGELSRAPRNIAPEVTLTITENNGVGKATLTGPIRNLLIGGVDDDEFFSLDNLCAQNITTCQLVINSPLNGATLCSDSVRVNVVARLTNVVRPFTIQFDVNGVKATFADTNLTVKVPLRPGANTLVATATVTDSSNMAVCVESVAVTRDSIARNLVINEILADPNYDDLGTEKIELKNIGSTPILLDSTLALWIRRGSLDTYWTFRKKRVTLAPNQFFVIHWLGKGPDDDGNVFTDLPTDGGGNTARDGFWGNNSATASNMTLGGVGNSNKEAFSIALVQNIVPGAATGFNNSCNLLDFVQICGRVPDSESVAVEAGIWSAGFSLNCPKEGISENLTPGGDYESQNPSVGDDPTALPKNHLLITEICLKPDNSEFVEIYNPTGSPIVLSDYYLTNMATDSIGYARLVSGTSGSSGFIVQFPATEVIPPLTFKTIAMEASRFSARYNVKPAYEIKDTDDGVLNMRIIPRGDTTYRLNDLDGALTLLNWVQRDSSDLVKDVDYVVWGEKNIIIVKNPERSPFEESANSQGGKTLAALKPPDVGINKTGLGIDGPDRNTTRSYYNSETAIRRQIPIANNPHADLKSWQRTNFLETGELLAGGNGLAGHDEMSENLAAAFKEDKPTPGTSTKVGPLDGLTQKRAETFQTILDRSAKDTRLIAKGFPNKLINPGEIVSVVILLQNNNDRPTGAFFGILRPLDSVVTMIDSTANFPSIAGSGASDSSRAPYVFKVDDVILPDSLYFQLVMIQKGPNPPKSGKSENVSELNAVTVRVIIIVLPTVNLTFDIAYSLPLQATSKLGSNLMRFDYTLIFVPPMSGTGYTATEMNVSVNSQNLDSSLFAKVVPQVLRPFTFGNNAKKVTPDALLLKLAQKFRDDQPSSFDLIFSWNEPCTDCGAYPGVPNGQRPITGGVTITSALLDSLTVSGKILYYANGSDPDGEPTPQPIDKVNIFVKRPNATRFPMTTMIRTNVEGIFSFKVGKSDTGAYRIYATLPPLTAQMQVSAIGTNDTTQARLLIKPPQFSMENDQVFKRLAANAHRDSVINNCDVMSAILNTMLPPGCDPTKVRRGVWTFVDAALTSVTNATFYSAKDTVEFRVRNYGRQANFAGVVYGDADGCLGTFFPTPCIGAGSPPTRLTTVQRSRQDVPREFFLSQNYPNPFNPATRIAYGLPSHERVLLQIFNVVGQLVYTGVDQSQPAGYYAIDWDGRNQDGKSAPAGIYLMRLQAGAHSQVRKLALVK